MGLPNNFKGIVEYCKPTWVLCSIDGSGVQTVLQLVTAKHQSCISARIRLREDLLLKESIIALQMLSLQQDPEGVGERKVGQAWLRLDRKLVGY